MSHIALFVIRIICGSLVAGHGSQKLFGWFDGPGLKNWSNATESMGMKPGSFFGPAGAVGEFGGGTLTYSELNQRANRPAEASSGCRPTTTWD